MYSLEMVTALMTVYRLLHGSSRAVKHLFFSILATSFPSSCELEVIRKELKSKKVKIRFGGEDNAEYGGDDNSGSGETSQVGLDEHTSDVPIA
jgi:hypothetical protein